MGAINKPEGLITEKVFKDILKAINSGKLEVKILFGFSDDPCNPNWKDADLFYQLLVDTKGYFAIEQSISFLHDGKLKSRLTELLQQCKEYESVVRKDMYNNVSNVFGEEIARELTFDVPISENTIWRYVDRKKSPHYYRDVATIVCHYVNYKCCWEDEFWNDFLDKLMTRKGVKQAQKTSELIMNECSVWEEYFGQPFTCELQPIEKPDVKSMSVLEKDFYRFLQHFDYWHLFDSLRVYISKNQDEIFDGITQVKEHSQKAALLLAFATHCIVDNRYDQLLNYHNRLNDITGDDKYTRMIISKANYYCRKCGYAYIPLSQHHENAKDNSEYIVPWEDVTFEYCFYRIDNIRIEGMNPISYRYADAYVDSVYNWLRYFFRMKVDPIVLKIENGTVTGGRFPIFSDYVTKLGEFSDLSTIQFECKEPDPQDNRQFLPRKIHRINFDDFRYLVPEGKDVYVDKLCRLMMNSDSVLEFTENNRHSCSSHLEKGFAFLLADSDNVKTYAFENHEDSRSTLIFKVEDSTYFDDLQLVADFLISDEKNKRQAMQRGYKISFGNRVLNYDRINHDDDWDDNIQRIVNI